MKYLGGKYFIGKEIANVMKDFIPQEYQNSQYLEPFCGALSVLTHMNEDFDCIASDYHPDLIEMWKKVQDNTFKPPKSINEQQYEKIKNYKSPNALKAFIGFGCSFGGRFFGAYAPKYANGKNEDYLKEAVNSINRKRPKIQGVKFNCISYDKLNPINMIIYCDPPYKFSKFPIKYRRDVKYYDIFDNEKFWNIIRKWSKNNIVFISEVTAPDDFLPIWDKKSHRTVAQSKKTRYKSKSDVYTTEKLFIHHSLIKK